VSGGAKWWWWAGAAGLLYLLYPRRVLGYDFANPVAGGVLRSGWGEYRDAGRTHVGIDIGADAGTPIESSLAGVVVDIDTRGLTIEGRVVAIRSGELVIRYLHLDDVAVKLGQRVGRGEIIGTVGTTGNASYPHVHIDVSASDAFLQRFRAKFGEPTDGFWRATGYGTVVPAETLIPVSARTASVQQMAQRFGVTLR
jgi:murein DD-endopeptidase MepM/ murein hydrolase activator NlpD